MKFLAKFTLASLLTLLCFCNFAQAGDLWTYTLPKSRFYLSVKYEEKGFSLRHFSQPKGEFQTLLSSTPFKSRHDLNNYVSKKFPNYKEQESLELWPIEKSFEKNIDKLFGNKKNQSIWYAKNQWNAEWEAKYSKWIQEEITADFYKQYKIPTDCADALVGLRWIFARINSLPVANTVADSGNLFGNFSMKKNWKKYGTAEKWHEDQLFLAALDFVMNLTSTRTVINDGYPVSIDSKGLVPGTYIITKIPSGHARIITETHYDNATDLPLYTLASTVPRDVRVLAREIFLDQDWPVRDEREILAFRWPVIVNSEWVLQKKSAHSNYSEEQFDSSIKERFPSFIQFVLSRVKESYDPVELVDMAINDVRNYANQRISIVKEGFEYCQKNNCRPGSAGDDNWGTPSRDAKLLQKFQDADTLVRQFEVLSPGLSERWLAGLRNTTLTVEGVNLKMTSLRFIMESNLFSSVPTDTPARRWGLATEELLSNWTDSASKLFKERNDVITKEQVCGSDCYPKTNVWVGLSTYHIDAELNKLYVQVTTYCTLINDSECLKYFSSKGQGLLTYNNESKTLDSWFKAIPYFHSDPRVGLERRWGKLPKEVRAMALPYHETLKVGKNSLALIDSEKVLNLINGKTIYENGADSRLVMTGNGIVYKISDSRGEIQRMNWSNDKVAWINIADPDQLMQLEKARPVHVTENNGHTIFKKPLEDGEIIFRIRNDQIQFIKEHSGRMNHQGSLITVALDKTILSFIDLDREQNIDINLVDVPHKFDMKFVRISSYSYPFAILNYSDYDEDQDYAVLVNVVNKTWTRIAPSLEEKYLVLWSSAKLKKAIFQTSPYQEFPTVYTVSWDEENKFTVNKMSNLLEGVVEKNGSVYFISGTGGQWDSNIKTKLYHWDTKLEELIAPADFEVKFLNSFGAYYTSSESGLLRMLGTTKNLNLPKDLLAEDEFCQIQTKVEEIFSYRFSTSYGDYSCMGGSLLKSDLTDQKAELVPQFSLYYWINRESLLDLNWQKTFAEFDVRSGTVIGLGRNTGLWWSSIE